MYVHSWNIPHFSCCNFHCCIRIELFSSLCTRVVCKTMYVWSATTNAHNATDIVMCTHVHVCMHCCVWYQWTATLSTWHCMSLERERVQSPTAQNTANAKPLSTHCVHIVHHTTHWLPQGTPVWHSTRQGWMRRQPFSLLLSSLFVPNNGPTPTHLCKGVTYVASFSAWQAVCGDLRAGPDQVWCLNGGVWYSTVLWGHRYSVCVCVCTYVYTHGWMGRAYLVDMQTDRHNRKEFV